MIRPNWILASVILTCGMTTLHGQAQTESTNNRRKSVSTDLPMGVTSFLKQYCLRCHGPDKPKGNLTLHELANLDMTGPHLKVWKEILFKIKSGEMPPEQAKQPPTEQREKLILWVEQKLRNAGESVTDARWASPSAGNWLDHDSLFSQKITGKTSTRGRLWRLTGQAYEEFVQSLNVKYRLGFKTYGHHRVRAPWQLAPREGFRDYASLHRIGEPEIEHHLRNATRVARAMVSRLPKTKIEQIQPLKILLKTGRASTAKQVESATHSAFAGILGRSPSKDELNRYSGFLQSNLKRLDPDKAIEQLLIAVLFHPEITYRIELPIEGEKPTLMPPRDLARAIAFALTDREPDEVLMQAAESGKLDEPEEIRAQVLRILKDPNINKPRILRFFQELFGYTAAIDVFKDGATRKAAGFRGKNDWHPNFFVNDADRLVEWVLASDKNVLRELLTTTKTFTLTGDTKIATGVKKNATKPFSLFAKTTLDIYEIKIRRQEWTDEKPFEMPKEHRMGILTHPSWLIAHSTNFDNHAIHRGHWIRERLLGGRIPDLPVTVDATLPDEPHKTLRERMRVTREAYCWKCHQSMDPLGLPFERFDHFGRHRTTELDKPVDTTGKVMGSGDPQLDGTVKDPFDLIRRLASSSRVEQVFVRHAFRYFIGRNETLADGPTLVAAHQTYVKSGGSMNALIAHLLTSDAFLYRSAEVVAAEK